ncbi:hypothetical protein NDU88_008978 [Pleurodeles waltl]|uniref:Uncharacterized protein n=1 Tax=Pleurodeles waltl TaxID=8319 RepID=A0AAV7P2I3_PLEWA|nr:hypothetical protein NDU88_008977 [Pleurodeles waltl]KAJ1120829.1 hypothetical protein NDU88_008978 [Pleurodeles waltl]
MTEHSPNAKPTFHDRTDTAGDHRRQPSARGDGCFYFLLDTGDQIHTNRHRKLPLLGDGVGTPLGDPGNPHVHYPGQRPRSFLTTEQSDGPGRQKQEE